MHPYVSGLLARSRAQELEQAAAAWRAAHPGGSTRRNRSRRHLGGRIAELEADMPVASRQRSSARPAQLLSELTR